MKAEKQGTVVLIGYQDMENLGLRYLSACLKKYGHKEFRVSFSEHMEKAKKVLKQVSPELVGFSLIFQNLTPEFADLISFLRPYTDAHFTIGGHYPSFEYNKILKTIPELDSVIRFEGEKTILELLNAILSQSSLEDVPGIAWRNQFGRIIANPLRKGCENLDLIPWPDRIDISYKKDYLSTASMIGSRGCTHNCNFCSITPFYRENGTPGRRLRNPENVVDEMEMLQKRGVDVVLFQDDDFLAGGSRGVKWAHSIAKECMDRDLNSKIRWRVSCRSDEVTEETLSPLVKAGLSHIYLGVESGDKQHLRDLSKKIKAEDHFFAKDVIRKFNISFDFGFMLLTPWSTFDSIRNNLSFLRDFVGNGEAPCGFSRTLPYSGTEIAKRLDDENRIKSGFEANYKFLDPRLDVLYTWLYVIFNKRNNDPIGTRNLLSLSLFEALVDLPSHPLDRLHINKLQSLTSVSNCIMFDIIEMILDYIEPMENPPNLKDPYLQDLKAHQERQDQRIRDDIDKVTAIRLESLSIHKSE